MTLSSRRIVLSLFLAACAIAVPTRLFGQGHTWPGVNLQQLLEAARWHIGTARLNAAFELRNAGYDSDIYYGYLSEPTPDYTITYS